MDETQLTQYHRRLFIFVLKRRFCIFVGKTPDLEQFAMSVFRSLTPGRAGGDIGKAMGAVGIGLSPH